MLLKDGLVYDGSGCPPRHGDVAVADGHIAERATGETIDCTNLAIAPGFIDLHSHSDLQVLEGRMEKVKQGVTLEVVGNCGFSPFPCRGGASALIEFGAGILGREEGWGWPQARDYFEAGGSRAAVLVGHGALRIAVMGMRQSAPSETELQHMEALLAEALDQGCAGFSTGLMYAPGSSAAREELVRLCAVVAARGKLYATHMRSYSAGLVDAVEEQLDLARTTGCRLQISHLQAAGRDNWKLQRRALDLIEQAHAAGVDVEFDIYPYQCGSTVLTQWLPQSALDGGREALLARLQSAAARRAILDEMARSTRPEWSDVTISSVDRNPSLIGKTVAQIAAQRACDPAVTVLDLLVEEEARVNVVSFNQSEENLRELLTHPLCSVISDGFYVSGKPHPRLHGTFPELLGSVVRERGWMTLEQAIHKISAKPASRLRLAGRGRIAPGNSADITVFDPATVAGRATYAEPQLDPVGIHLVMRAGRILWRPGFE